ncbi:MAG: alpha/beta hydrolase [Clostridia bacterium]|nr:alpha/beta hydrolase [Clostridia bacterium]
MNYLWKKECTPLFDDKIPDQNIPSVIPYIIENSKSCIVIYPGGGYALKAFDHEGHQIAQWLNSIGISAFILDYRVSPYKHPVPVIDGKRAVRYARYMADKFGYDKDKIGVLGFSAGGHLAASVATYKGDFGYDLQDDIDKESSKPDFMVLCYPVVSFTHHRHHGSFINLAPEPTQDMAKRLSIENNVDSSTPPAFIWHTSGDAGVPVENSLILAMELSRYNISFEIHTHKDGPHGQGLAPNYPYTAFWAKECENWLKSMNYID